MKLIVISGPTGSGKTTLAKKFLKELKNVIVLNTDNYYKIGIINKLLSIFVDCYFDRKISFNEKLLKKDLNFILESGESNHKYLYDFKKKSIKKVKKKESNIDYLIIEGIFTKYLLNNLDKYGYIHIELKIDKKSCMDRVIKRDLEERGKNKNNAKKDFLKSWKLYYNNYYKKSTSVNSIEFTYTNKKDLNSLVKKVINLKI